MCIYVCMYIYNIKPNHHSKKPKYICDLICKKGSLLSKHLWPDL